MVAVARSQGDLPFYFFDFSAERDFHLYCRYTPENGCVGLPVNERSVKGFASLYPYELGWRVCVHANRLSGA
jgi:hypothetical protein